MPSTFGLAVVSGGLQPASGNQTALITGGLFTITKAQPGSLDSSPYLLQQHAAQVTAGLQVQFGGGAVPPTGTVSASVGIPIGPGNLNVNFSLSDLLQNPMSATGSQIFNPDGLETQEYVNNTATYTGSDLRIIVDPVNATTTAQSDPGLKQLIECTTFTVSIHREKAAVRAAGYINPKGFARGRRTIAGTLVLTQFTIDVLYRFLMGQYMNAHDLSKDTLYVKVDQLPPFNMTLLFTDEYGNVSYRRVLGVDFVTDGVVYSSNDLMTEQTVSYMASDFTPLVNIDSSTLFRPNVTSQIFAPERTVQTVLSQNNSQQAIPNTNIFSGVTPGAGF